MLILLAASFFVGVGLSIGIALRMPRSTYVMIFLIMSLAGGTWFFVSINGKWAKSDLGNGIEVLVNGAFAVSFWLGFFITCFIGPFQPESIDHDHQ